MENKASVLSQAKDAVVSGDFELAIRLYESLLSGETANPDDVSIYNHLGEIYASQKNPKKAVETYQKALQIDQNNPILQYNLAKSYVAMHNDSEAIAAFEAVLRAKPGWIEAIQDYAVLLLDHRKTRAAFDLVKNAIEIHKDNSDLYFLSAQILMRQSNPQEALDYLLKADELCKNNAKILSLLSDTYLQLGKNSEAVDMASQALECALPEQKTEMQIKLASAYLFSNQIEKSSALLASLMAENENNTDVINLQGQIHIFNHNDDGISACETKIREIDLDYYEHLKFWGLCYKQLGEYEKSRKLFMQFLDENNKNAPMWVELAKIDLLLEDKTAALDDYSTALAFDPANFAAKNGSKELEDKTADEPVSTSSEIIGEEVDLDFLMDSDFSVEETETVEDAVEETGNTDESSEDTLDYDDDLENSMEEDLIEEETEKSEEIEGLSEDEEEVVEEMEDSQEPQEVVGTPTESDKIESSQNISGEVKSGVKYPGKGLSYVAMMSQVSDLLPKIEKILANTEEAQKFKKQIGLFEQLKNLSDFLPDSQKQDFMESKNRLLIEFLIAYLSGKPGLLKTTDSLRKSGVIDIELAKASPSVSIGLSFEESLIAVLKSMCELAESLPDKAMANGLITMAQSALEKLEKSVC